MKKLLLIDNYDSFTYNLVQYFQELGNQSSNSKNETSNAEFELKTPWIEIIVKRNDEITAPEAEALAPNYLVFSPGPGTVENPDDVGVGTELFEKFRGQIPILGVCLGQQMIGHILGGEIIKVEPKHGKRWPMRVLDKSGLFQNFDDQFEGMRYHSMVVDRKNLPKDLTITAETDDEEKLIMAFERPEEKIFGVQFHPESVGTKTGMKILENFLKC